MMYFVKHELKYYFKNIKEAIYIYSYFISIVLLSPFALRLNEAGQQHVAILALWVALASAVAMAGENLFRRDREQGLLEYYQLMTLPLEAIVAAKWLAFIIFLSFPLLASLPLAGILFNLSVAQLGHYAIGLGAGALALSVISVLLGALLSGLEKAGAVLSLLILPLCIPVLIFGAEYCRDFSGNAASHLVLILGFAAFMFPVMCWAGASAIRNSN